MNRLIFEDKEFSDISSLLLKADPSIIFSNGNRNVIIL